MLEPVKEVLNDKMYSLHWSVMYDPIIHLSTVIEDSIYETFSIEYVDPFANPGGFTTAAVDNIDNNRSSNTAKESSHSTNISIFQHFFSLSWPIRHNLML